MNTVLSKPPIRIETGFATILIVPEDKVITRISDACDFKVRIIRKGEQTSFELSYQVDPQRELIDVNCAKSLVDIAYKKIVNNFQSPAFIDTYGECTLYRSSEKLRMVKNLTRVLIKDLNRQSNVIELTGGGVGVYLRFGRGRTIICIPSKNKENALPFAANGEVNLLGDHYLFWVRRPGSNESDVIGEELLRNSFYQKFRELFPFIRFNLDRQEGVLGFYPPIPKENPVVQDDIH